VEADGSDGGLFGSGLAARGDWKKDERIGSFINIHGIQLLGSKKFPF